MSFIPVYLLVVIVLTNRYFAGLFCKHLRRDFDARVQGFEPTVAVVVPMFNEGKGIYSTILSLLEQDYPAHKLGIVVVDDCSKDDSYAWARRAEAENPGRVRVITEESRRPPTGGDD